MVSVLGLSSLVLASVLCVWSCVFAHSLKLRKTETEVWPPAKVKNFIVNNDNGAAEIFQFKGPITKGGRRVNSPLPCMLNSYRFIFQKLCTKFAGTLEDENTDII